MNQKCCIRMSDSLRLQALLSKCLHYVCLLTSRSMFAQTPIHFYKAYYSRSYIEPIKLMATLFMHTL